MNDQVREREVFSKQELFGANIGALNDHARSITRQTTNIPEGTAEAIADFEEIIYFLSPATNGLITAHNAELDLKRAENSQAIKDLNTALSGGMKQQYRGSADRLLNTEVIEVEEERV